MDDVSRSTALERGVATAAASPLIALLAGAAAAQEYGPEDGKQLYPDVAGVRVVEIGEMPSEIAAYSKVMIVDVIHQPGTGDPGAQMMDMDMVCFITAGEYRIRKDGGKEFSVKKGDIYTCGEGNTDWATNVGDVYGVHRIALLVPA
jgi:hypothetical protein